MIHLLGIGAGDEVIVPSFSFIATANCVRYVGATPVFADVQASQRQPRPRSRSTRCITPRTTAIIAVHQGGHARRHRGAARRVDGRHPGAGGRGLRRRLHRATGSPSARGALLAAWSFHPRKLVTTGEGGMVTTDDAEWATRLRRLREHGMTVSAADRHAAGSVKLEQYLETAFNYRMTDLQAAIGLVQLRPAAPG